MEIEYDGSTKTKLLDLKAGDVFSFPDERDSDFYLVIVDQSGCNVLNLRTNTLRQIGPTCEVLLHKATLNISNI